MDYWLSRTFFEKNQIHIHREKVVILVMVCVNTLEERLKPNMLSDGFKRLLELNGMRIIRLHVPAAQQRQFAAG